MGIDPNTLRCVTCTTAVRGSKTYVFSLFHTSRWEGSMKNDKYIAFVDPFDFTPSRLTYADRILMQHLRAWKEYRLYQKSIIF